jgi:hypothetical protein
MPPNQGQPSLELRRIRWVGPFPMTRILCATAAVLLLTTMRISAHHSFSAEDDENKLVTVSGTVMSFQSTNPHAWLYVGVKDENGKVTSWRFEMGSPNGLVHRGWTRTDLKKGDAVTVDGYAARNGSNTANARTVTLPGGRSYSGASRALPAPPPGRNALR